ncbi:type VI secretion system ATPase TssH [Paraburkholderia hayleyella]|uniref:type VI secretion system ATPase TssH n=1 Tax=Paraburkholderia hayleyella TaxID=2152889 RepID=UPI0012917FCB|nr:type VI secretion system ATPase TssH [Paraburkholderia hayleyella]
MIQLDLKALFARLNPFVRQALEDGAGLALARSHYEIGVEHLLRKLLDEPAGDVPLLLAHAQIDVARLRHAVDTALAELKSGNAGRPVFAPLLTEWVQDAWMVSSVTLGQTRIRSAALLLALLERSGYYVAGMAYAQILRPVQASALREAFASVCEASLEGPAQDAPEAGGVGGAGSAMGGQATGPAGESALMRFCEDFTAKAVAGKIDPVFGRDAEIRQIIDILARRRKNNPICVGEPGVGKTALVEGLALRIAEGDVPESMLGTRLLGLDLGLLEAGASVKGEFERRLRQVIDEVKASAQPVILFIDEAHMLIGAGGQAGGGDAANLLKPALARGELRTIAATTWSEYKKYFEKDAALARRFQLVKLDAPDVAATIHILRGLKDAYEKSHGVTIRDDALVAAAELSHRYITGRQLPDKAVDLLDTAAARVRISQNVKPAELEQVERTLLALSRERAALSRDASFGYGDQAARLLQIEEACAALKAQQATLTARWQAERQAALALLAQRGPAPGAEQAAAADEASGAAADEATAAVAEAQTGAAPAAALTLQAARAALEALQGDDPLLFTDVGPETVAKVVADWTGIPLGRLQRDRAATVMALADTLKARIRGQEGALERIVDIVKSASSGLKDPLQPLGVFLLTGPSGVGKTETALSIADHLFGGEAALVTINMSEFQERHTVSRLVGSPPGYVGYGEGGLLTEAVRQRPYSVVLLDEVEKAHLDVVNICYQIFDKGTLSDGEGRDVDFSNTVVFLTANLASEQIVDACAKAEAAGVAPDLDALVAQITPALAKHFKPALLARMTVIPYVTLPASALEGIVRLKLARISERLQSGSHIALSFAPEVVQAITQRCHEVESGARNIDFIVRKHVLPRLSDVLLAAQCDGRVLRAVQVSVAPDGSFAVTAQDADSDAEANANAVVEVATLPTEVAS